MFHASQHWYDLVYDAQGKDYAAEAGRIREILAGQGGLPRTGWGGPSAGSTGLRHGAAPRPGARP